MIPNSEWPCWEIMKCKGTEDCPARRQPERHCWEIARDLDDYRSAFNICQDCIVFMLKNGNSILSEKEVQTIVEKKVSCTLTV
jgi:hypothetical protein